MRDWGSRKVPLGVTGSQETLVSYKTLSRGTLGRYVLSSCVPFRSALGGGKAMKEIRLPR